MYQYNKTTQKLINQDFITKYNIQGHNSNWSRIFDHPYKILITGFSGSGKAKALLNLTKQQVDYDHGVIDKICVYVQDPNEAKY